MQKRPPVANPKLTPPGVHGVIGRERLFRKIEGAGSPVVWIAGPPDAGKSTLAASYVKGRRLPLVWYQIDAGDADPATFFYYLGQDAVGTPFDAVARPMLEQVPAGRRVIVLQ